MSADIGYILSVFLFLGGLVVVAGASLLVVEGAYWIYCKIRGRDY
jgi:hypothetical protein